jgi:hypothetical protein
MIECFSEKLSREQSSARDMLLNYDKQNISNKELLQDNNKENIDNQEY